MAAIPPVEAPAGGRPDTTAILAARFLLNLLGRVLDVAAKRKAAQTVA